MKKTKKVIIEMIEIIEDKFCIGRIENPSIFCKDYTLAKGNSIYVLTIGAKEVDGEMLGGSQVELYVETCCAKNALKAYLEHFPILELCVNNKFIDIESIKVSDNVNFCQYQVSNGFCPKCTELNKSTIFTYNKN